MKPIRSTAALLVATEDSHLTAEDVAAFLDRRMTTAERAHAEAHLADCSECREEVAVVRRLVRARPAVRPAVLFPIGVAAAAAIAFLAINIQRTKSEPSADRLRTPGPSIVAESPPRIGVLSPVDGDTLRSGKVAFLWSAIAGEPTYRLTLTDASGQKVWTTTTSDTSIALPPRVVPQSRTTYFWYVDALRADGRAASTGVRSFTVP